MIISYTHNNIYLFTLEFSYDKKIRGIVALLFLDQCRGTKNGLSILQDQDSFSPGRLV